MFAAQSCGEPASIRIASGTGFAGLRSSLTSIKIDAFLLVEARGYAAGFLATALTVVLGLVTLLVTERASPGRGRTPAERPEST